MSERDRRYEVHVGDCGGAGRLHVYRDLNVSDAVAVRVRDLPPRHRGGGGVLEVLKGEARCVANQQRVDAVDGAPDSVARRIVAVGDRLVRIDGPIDGTSIGTVPGD